MGTDKALVHLDGRPLAAVAAAALAGAGASEVFCVGGDLAALAAVGLEARPDEHPGQGPLGGVLGALALAAEAVVVVLSCDLPAIDAASVGALVDALDRHREAQVAVPVVEGRRQPVPAAYRRSARSALLASFTTGERALHRALAGLAVVPVAHLDPVRLADVDRPEDLRRYARPVTVPEIDVDELRVHHQAGAPIVDVRQPDEYHEAHVPGAQLIPLAEVPDRLGELPEARPLYLICRSGARSGRAGEFLVTEGYEVVNVAGGTLAWIDAGFPVDTGGAS